MDWIFFTFLSVISRAIYGVMTKVLSNKAGNSIYTQSVLLPLCGGLLAILLSPLLGGFNLNINSNNLGLIILVVLSQGLGNVVYFAAIKNLTSGTAQISFSSILVFNTILSILFLNLHLSFINGLGIIILMLAILLAVSGKIEFNKKGVGLMTLSAFLFSIFQLSTSRLSLQVSAATYLIIAYFGATLVVFVVNAKTVIKDISASTNKKNLFLIPFLTAIPSLGNFVFAYYAYRSAPEPAKVAMLLTSQVVFGVLLSYVFLKEKGYLFRKLLAAILVITAAVLIKS